MFLCWDFFSGSDGESDGGERAEDQSDLLTELGLRGGSCVGFIECYASWTDPVC